MSSFPLISIFIFNSQDSNSILVSTSCTLEDISVEHIDISCMQITILLSFIHLTFLLSHFKHTYASNDAKRNFKTSQNY